MIKVEIITDASRYEMLLVDFDNLKAADAFVGKELMKKDEAKFHCLDSVLTIDLVNSRIKSYKVWVTSILEDAKEIGQLPEFMPAAAPEGIPYLWQDRTNFLGRKLRIEGLAVDWGDKTYYLPTEVDGKRPHDVLDQRNLEDLMRGVTDQGGQAVVVIPPPVTLIGSEAAAFLVDFAQQHNEDPVRPGDVTARAAGSVLE
ncbi:hypothetical protein [Paenibacillus sp. L3-i20]|uniref:hypothetical protein n=1 Tax=Paenibacillus sp. L3-i20 TaxID=2905833 RepID=UPI001EDF4867|nr:hypothetical protein [Paenibacillus sp. L3-i20]GKU79315.1 hypothetical protein L3i20_v237120 [Paenibacillus sp. L3-i20]